MRVCGSLAKKKKRKKIRVLEISELHVYSLGKGLNVQKHTGGRKEGGHKDGGRDMGGRDIKRKEYKEERGT